MIDSLNAPVFLIGYRGTGKSAVARELANALGFEALDADAEIERRSGKTIAEIFAQEGEPAFRDLEARVVSDFAARRRAVIALGGGAVLRDENRQSIRGAGPVVWLTASVDTILKRIAADASTATRRPNLTALGGRKEIESILTARTPMYRQCATLVVDTEGKSPAQVAAEIAARL